MNTDFIDQDLDEAWECPTCLQPFPPHHDYECGTCEAKASEHLRVTTMCRLLREVSGREAKLTVERDKLNGLLIRLYNDLFVHHSGTAIADLKKEFREENYN